MIATPLEIERLKKYEGLLRDGCTKKGEDPFLWAALMLRESGAGYAAPYWPKGDPCGWGDGSTQAKPELGFGFGLFQIDRRFHGAFLKTEEAKNPAGQLRYAIDLHQSNVRFMQASFPDKGFPFQQQAALAAYNCGPGNVKKAYAESGDVDARTAGKDYSKWILAKRDAIKAAAPTLFKKAEAAAPSIALENPWVKLAANVLGFFLKKK